MSGREPVTVARFAAEHEARVAAEELEAEGIQTFLTGTEFGAMYGSWVGTAAGGIEVQVARDDLPRAREILTEFSNADATDWQCSQCGTDVEGEFAVCWNCGAERELAADAIAEAHKPAPDESDDFVAAEASPECSLTDVESASAKQKTHGQTVRRDEVTDRCETLEANDALADRAFRVAGLGILFCPMLFLSIPLVVRVSLLNLSARGTRRFYFSLLICVASSVLWLTVLWMFAHAGRRL
jgi:hypothetical protein